jgi:hypothetical protein
MSNIEELKDIFINNKDKRICVLGTTCTNKINYEIRRCD